MEQQKYTHLAKIMLATKSNLSPNRPVHMFGCGHPMLFPMPITGCRPIRFRNICLVCKRWSIANSLGTEKISEIEEWPIIIPAMANYTPAEVRKMNKENRTILLSKFNLEVTLQNSQGVVKRLETGPFGVWQRRSPTSALREAFLWLTTNPQRPKWNHLFSTKLALPKKLERKGRWEENGIGWLIRN